MSFLEGVFLKSVWWSGSCEIGWRDWEILKEAGIGWDGDMRVRGMDGVGWDEVNAGRIRIRDDNELGKNAGPSHSSSVTIRGYLMFYDRTKIHHLAPCSLSKTRCT